MSDGKQPDRVHIIRDVQIEDVAGNGFEAHETVIASGIDIRRTGGHGMVIGGAGSVIRGCSVDMSKQPKRGRAGDTAASVAAAVTAAAIAKAMGLN